MNGTVGAASAATNVPDWTALFAARTRGGVGEGLIEILSLASATDVISFAGGFPDPTTFPGGVLADILADLLESGDASALQYAPTPGLPGLRDFIALRLERLDGPRPAPEELLVTSGAIEALELIGKSFLDPRDLVLVEGPTYLGAIMAFRSFEAEVEAVPVDEEGLRTDALEAALGRGRRPKLLYSIPDHQNPSGVSLSGARRRQLVGLARRFGFLVVEDVAYREIHFDDRPLPSLWSMAPESVVQVGTFSKTFFPGVRLGWAVGPADVIGQLAVAKQNTDQCAGALGQRLLERYGALGHLDAQIERARILYARRRDLLLEALAAHLPQEANWSRPHGGFFTWLTIAGDVDTTELAARARGQGIAYVPGSVFFPDGSGRRNLRLAFSHVEEDAIGEGARRLGVLLRDALSGAD